MVCNEEQQRVVAIGDIHGCLDLLDELLRKVEYTSKDRLVSLGDLIDKGPDSVGVVRRMRELGATVLIGNHEAKHILYRKRIKQERETGRPNKMTLDAKRIKVQESLTDEMIEWMDSLPYFVCFPATSDNSTPWVAVHGGFENRLTETELASRPLFAMEQHGKQDKMVRLRYVDSSGASVATAPDLKTTHPDAVRWPLRWKGPESVLYGHAVYSLDEPTGTYSEPLKREGIKAVTGDRQGPCTYTFGIDTGAVHGGYLTAAILPSDRRASPPIQFVQVKAHKEHHPFSINPVD